MVRSTFEMLFPRGLATLEAHPLWLVAAAGAAASLSAAAVCLIAKSPNAACWAVLGTAPLCVLLAGGRALAFGTGILRSSRVPLVSASAENLGYAVTLALGSLASLSALFALLRMVLQRRQVAVAIKAVKAATECFKAKPQLVAIVAFGHALLTVTALAGAAGLARIAASAKGSADLLEADDAQWASLFGLARQFKRSAYAVGASLAWAWLVLWLCAVVECATRFTVAFVSTLWYFSMPDLHGRKDELPSAWRIAGAVLRYHSGTVALSALLLAPLECLSSASSVATFVGGAACLQTPCFLALSPVRWIMSAIATVHTAARTLGDAAYVECVLHSTDYFKSCLAAARRLRSGLGSVCAVHGVTRRFTNTLAIAASLVIGVCAFDIASAVGSKKGTDWSFESPLSLALCSTFLAYLVSKLTFTCLDEIADALLYCFMLEAKGPFGIVFAPESVPALIEQYESEDAVA
eukprot:Polyplicarium_translucidae@DN2240_c0_g1_i1.p1